MDKMMYIGFIKIKIIKFFFKQSIYSVKDSQGYFVDIRSNNLIEFIEKYLLYSVDFHPIWCAIYRIITLVIRPLSKIYKIKRILSKLDFKKNQHIARELKIIAIPILVYFGYTRKTFGIPELHSVGNIKNEIDGFLKIRDR
jgi:thioredoxin-like negative regulator of GroEL